MKKINNLSLIVWASVFVCIFSLFLGFSLCSNKVDIIEKAEISSKQNYSYGTSITTYILFKTELEGEYFLKVDLFDKQNNLICSEKSDIFDIKNIYQYASESILVGNDKNIQDLTLDDLKIEVTAYSYNSTASKLNIAGYSLFPFLVVSGYFLTIELYKFIKEKKQEEKENKEKEE